MPTNALSWLRSGQVGQTEVVAAVGWRPRATRSIGGCAILVTVAAPTPIGIRPKDRRFAELAAVLSRAVAASELEASYALRILRHQLRVMNVNGAVRVKVRSEDAQAVVARYEATGEPIPKNGSDDAFHCDHVHALTADELAGHVTTEAWIAEVVRLREVVCVTAAENYRLEKVEHDGVTGWANYDAAGIKLLHLTS